MATGNGVTTTGVSSAGREAAPTMLPRRAALVGPAMRTRARILVSVAFVVALPALVVGMIRNTNAGSETESLVQAEALAELFRGLYVRFEEARAATYRIEAEASPDARRALKIILDQAARAILDAEAQLFETLNEPSLAVMVSAWRDPATEEPLLPAGDPLRRLKESLGQTRVLLAPMLEARRGQRPEPGAYRRAHEALNGALREAGELVLRSRAMGQERARRTSDAISRAGRDQLVLFLLLLFLFPVVGTWGPSWMIAPVERLRGVAKRIGSGRGRDILPSADDEIGELTRALKDALTRLEESDQKKTHKIFEMRKLVRALLARLDEPVIVVGRGGQIDYVSERATEVLGSERHHIEGKTVEDVCFSPQLCEAIDAAREGDVPDDDITVTLEPADGRVLQLKASVLGVQDQDGRVSRVVVVLHP